MIKVCMVSNTNTEGAHSKGLTVLTLVQNTGQADFLHKHFSEALHMQEVRFSRVSLSHIEGQIILYVCVNELSDIAGSEVAETCVCVPCEHACTYMHVDV